jgi:large subunit ribosomal protein L4
VWKSLRNLGERVQILLPEELNTYDVLLNDWLVFSKASLDATIARLDERGGSVEAGAADADEVDDTDDSIAAEAS